MVKNIYQCNCVVLRQCHQPLHTNVLFFGTTDNPNWKDKAPKILKVTVQGPDQSWPSLTNTYN
jgi:hypothetical protein